MLYLQESFIEYPDNKSIVATLWFTGCSHNCLNCSNPQFQEFKELPEDWFSQVLNYLKRLKTNKLVLCGGDPLFEKNISYTKELLSDTDLEICIYTGSPIDIVKEKFSDILKYKTLKYIKCGPFIQQKYAEPIKTDECMQLSSTNQEMYKVEDGECIKISDNGKINFTEE